MSRLPSCFVEFDLGVEIAPPKEDFVKTRVAKCALEGLLASGVFFGGGFATAAGAFVPGAFLFETDGFADGLGGGVGGAAHIVLHALVEGKIVEVMKVLSGSGAVGFAAFQGVLLRLRMRVAHGDRSKGLHGCIRIRAKGCEFADAGGGQAADFGGGHRQQASELEEGSGIGATAQSESPLHGVMVKLPIHIAVHSGEWRAASASGRESADNVLAARLRRLPSDMVGPRSVKTRGSLRRPSPPLEITICDFMVADDGG